MGILIVPSALDLAPRDIDRVVCRHFTGLTVTPLPVASRGTTTPRFSPQATAARPQIALPLKDLSQIVAQPTTQ